MAKCAKNINETEFIKYSKIAVDKFCDAGRLSVAAELYSECGEFFEDNNYLKAE